MRYPEPGVVTSTTDEWRDGERRYHSTVEWTDQDGRPHDFIVQSSSAGTYPEGEAVALRYDPADPEDHRTGSLLAPLILGSIGAVFLGLLAWAFLHRNKPAPAPRADPPTS